MTQIHDAPPTAPENTGSTITEPTDEEPVAISAAADHPAEGDPGSPQPSGNAPTERPVRRINDWWRQRQTERRASRTKSFRTVPDRSGWTVLAVIALGLLVLTIVAVGLHTALGALRDAALAAHIEPTAATLYWIGVDGLIVVAIIAAMVLRHEPWARWYALGVVAVFTLASGLLQYLHGRGQFTPDRVTGIVPPLPPYVVLVIAALVIGTIFCGTHMFVYVLRHLFPRTVADQAVNPITAPTGADLEPVVTADPDSDTGDGSPAGQRSGDDQSPPVAIEPDPLDIAKLVYAACLDAEVKLSRKKLAEVARISERQAGHIRTDVEVEREEAAERERLAEQERAEAERLAAAEREAQRDSKTINGSPVQADLTTIGGA